MKGFVKAGKADHTVDVFILDSSSTTGAGLTGLAYNTASLVCYYRKGATGSATAITLATQTVGGAHADGGFVEISSANMPGLYRLDLPDAVIDTAGVSKVMLKGATNMAPVILELQCVAFNPDDGVRLGLTALPNAAADAAGGLIISDAGGLDADAQRSDVAAILVDTGTTLDGRIPAALVSGRMDASVGAYQTGLTPLQPTTAGRTLDVSAGGEAGLDWANIGSPTTSQTLSGTTISTSQAVASVSGSVGSVTGAVGSVTGSVGSVTGNVGGNVTGSVGSLATQAKADVNAEVDAALADIHLDHLIASADPGSIVANSSLLAKLTSKSATPAFTSFDNTTDSLEAIADGSGGGGGGATAQQVWEYASRTLTSSGTITVVSPVDATTSDLSLYSGDDYNNSDTNREISWTSTDWPDLTDAVATFCAYDAAGLQVLKKTGSVVTPTGTAKVRVVLTAAESAILRPDESYTYDMRAVLATSSRVITLAVGAITVSR